MDPEPLTSKRRTECQSYRGAILRAMLALATLLIVTASSHAQAAPTSGDLIRVEIAGFRNDKGGAICALFSSAKDFPKNGDKAIAHAKSGISRGRAVCEFPAIAPGRYAVSVFHDENSNGKMDTNFMGIPREGVGASNNAIGHFGPPKFDAAAFQYAGGKLDLTITIAYL